MCCHPENPLNELSKGDSHYECNVVNIVSCKNNDMIENDFSVVVGDIQMKRC